MTYVQCFVVWCHVWLSLFVKPDILDIVNGTATITSRSRKDVFRVFCTGCHCDVEIGSKRKSLVYQHTTTVNLICPPFFLPMSSFWGICKWSPIYIYIYIYIVKSFSCLKTREHASGLNEYRNHPKDSGFQSLLSVFPAILKNGTVNFCRI